MQISESEFGAEGWGTRKNYVNEHVWNKLGMDSRSFVFYC